MNKEQEKFLDELSENISGRQDCQYCSFEYYGECLLFNDKNILKEIDIENERPSECLEVFS